MGIGCGSLWVLLILAFTNVRSPDLYSDRWIAMPPPSQELLGAKALADQVHGCPENRIGPTGGSRVPRTPGQPTFFCWILVTPSLHELLLMRVHLCLNTSLFACDDHLVISNTSIKGLMKNVPGVHLIKEVVMPVSLSTQYSGRWNTSMNSELFLSAWSIVWSRNLHLMDFTLKLDADTMMQTDRLAPLLMTYSREEREAAIYFESCSWCEVKLIGPIEVFSRRAMKMLAQRKDLCRSEIPHDDISEDAFLELCAKRLGIQRVFPRNKLLWPEWKVNNVDLMVCRDGYVAVHPLKSECKLLACYELSMGQVVSKKDLEPPQWMLKKM